MAEQGENGRFDAFLLAAGKISPLAATSLIVIASLALGIWFIAGEQHAWAFSCLVLLTVSLIVSAILRPGDAARFQLVLFGAKLFIENQLPAVLEQKVEEKIARRPANLPTVDPKVLKAEIVREATLAARASLEEYAYNLRQVLGSGSLVSSGSFALALTKTLVESSEQSRAVRDAIQRRIMRLHGDLGQEPPSLETDSTRPIAPRSPTNQSSKSVR